jgi:signal transduction histidine kinase/CheY-like chemotaxis protein
MTVKRTYPKIPLLIFSSSVFFIILFFALFYYTKQVEKQVFKNSKEQFANEVNKLLILDTKPIDVAIINDTGWDEFVEFIATKDTIWYNDNVGNEIDTYDVDYLIAYDKNKKYVIHTASSKIKSFDFIPKQAMADLHKTDLSRFYMKIPEGIIQVTGASIHPSDESKKNIVKPFGYFFVVRLLDKSYLKKLEELTNSQIQFVNSPKDKVISKHKIYTTIGLKDNQNKEVTMLLFERNFDVYFENTIAILYLIIAAFFINFVVTLIFTKKWVFNPLRLITLILETGEKNAIEELNSTTGEFRNIGNLFEENNHQKMELISAKLKAEEGDRLKSSFLANLSHEIRTPMNAINGFTDLLINTKLRKEEKLEYLKVIEKSGSNLVSIIDDLIEISKIESNQVTPNLTSVNVETCIKELYETIKITIPKSKEIDFRIIENGQAVPHNIVADEIKLKQVLVNLVNNAIKFTDKGYVAFGYEVDEINGKITFKIQDTGLGIDIDNLDYIFDRFKRLDSELSVKAGGLGLGLAISKAYVEMMGGTISLESKVNEGSTFSFSIPLEYNEEQRVIKRPTKSTIRINGKEARTILIAEDDNINFLLFQKIVKHTNYTIIRAVNGQEAVAFCSENPNIDLVFMDIKMPVMNGYEALEKIKTIRPELIVIAQTAYSSAEDEARIYNAGFYAYITKPINREKLFKMFDDVFLNTK